MIWVIVGDTLIIIYYTHKMSSDRNKWKNCLSTTPWKLHFFKGPLNVQVPSRKPNTSVCHFQYDTGILWFKIGIHFSRNTTNCFDRNNCYYVLIHLLIFNNQSMHKLFIILMSITIIFLNYLDKETVKIITIQNNILSRLFCAKYSL